MKKSFIKKTITFTLTCVLILGTISGSIFAKSRDFYDSTTNKIYSSPADMSDSDFNTFVDLLIDHGDKFAYEFNGKYYNYSAFLSDYGKNKKAGKGTADAFAATLGNAANIQTGFDPSAYSANTNPDDSDFSVISID